MKNFKFLIIFILFSQCGQLNKTEKIVDEIFPQLADSLNIDFLNFVIDAPPPLYSDDNVYLGFDTLQLKKNKRIREVLIDSIKNTNPKTYIIINDSIKFKTTNQLVGKTSVDKMLYDSIFIKSNKNFDSKFVRHDRISLDQFELVTFNQLVEIYGSPNRVWHSIKNRLFGGAIHIKGFLINEEDNYGVFQFIYTTVPIDGVGYMVEIEKKNEIWSITKIMNL